MRKTIAVLFVFLLFASCLRKPQCLETYPVIINNKREYNQLDAIRLKVVYSERASYKWFINDFEIPGNGSELIAKKPYTNQSNRVRCEAKIGNCVKEAEAYFTIENVNVPSCNFPSNTITIDNKNFQLSNLTYDAKNLTFKGKIIGPGASINDNINIQISPDIDIYADKAIMETAQPSYWGNRDNQVLVTITYGNVAFWGFTYLNLLYEKVPTGGKITCCNAIMTASQNGSFTLPTSFSVLINF